jgi:radical SAM protein with 4Fe4S-binding SPASM domain
MWRETYLRRHPQAALKQLEQPCLYHCGTDELYELDATALTFLARCDGTRRGRELTTDAAFVTYCLEEGLLEALPYPDPASPAMAVTGGQTPSLRYLELQLTHRCNLRCRHCYLGPPRPAELPLAAAVAIAEEFAANGGLRLLISGGEPLLYPALAEFLQEIGRLQLRRVLLTNGTLLSVATLRWLQIEEVQVSLDGWRHGHDRLRGTGSFDRARRGLAAVQEAGIPLSIATMVHQENIGEFDRLERFTREIGAREWGIDLLCPAGTLLDYPQLNVAVAAGVPLLRRAYGGGYHGASDGFACGRHLLTVLPSGAAVKCGFYADAPLGDARQGLVACWQQLRHLPVDELECRGCQVLADCAGGCRFRAGAPLAPDPVMCALHGVSPPPV